MRVYPSVSVGVGLGVPVALWVGVCVGGMGGRICGCGCMFGSGRDGGTSLSGWSVNSTFGGKAVLFSRPLSG